MEKKKKRITSFLKLVTTIALTLCISALQAQVASGTSKIHLDENSSKKIAQLQQQGFDLDHLEFSDAGNLILYVSAEEKYHLEQLGLSYTMLIPNMEAWYLGQLENDLRQNTTYQKGKNVADGFGLGSMGGYYTYDEIGLKLDAMRQKYPDIISEKVSIGTTIEGREIWMAKISDNPDIDENEPSAYFDALHHAREPISMAATINYMFWLLERYTTNPEIAFLIDNREIYFVPVVNPDGYEHNRATNPNGGGLWRKNRNPNSGGCLGVDLNRNYAFGYANDASCSSSDPCSGTYRGTAAFSEPETVAVRDLLAVAQPNTAFSTHSTAGTYLMPYGFDTNPPAFGIYSEWASAFLDENEYTYGVTFQMLGYTSCGTTRDYLHSEGIYGWTPEIDGSGFWPLPSEIFGLVEENVKPMLYQTWIAGAYIDVQSHTIIGEVTPGGNFDLVVEGKNVGVGEGAENVSVEIISSNPSVQVPPAVAYGTIPPRERASNQQFPFQIGIDANIQETGFTLIVNTFQDGVLNESLEIPVQIGQQETLFLDTAENGAANWTATGNGIQWGVVTDDSYSGIACFGDSNGGNSQNGTSNFFTLNTPVDLSGTTSPVVSFVGKHSLEAGDMVMFQLSDDGGTSWETLANFTQNKSWNVSAYSLSEYRQAGTVRFRFAMQTDGSIPGDGFYFDDFQVADYQSDVLSISTGSGSEITVFPNPFSNSLTISSTHSNSISEVRLVDISGRSLPVSVSHNEANTMLTVLETLGSGVYFLYFMEESHTRHVIKLLKQ
ncbi:MAG: hypothetical protein CMC08_03910 [Flavobacteriaceae bacterium]|nr:hypothetical protein [Flavobacteriaceae bacterium]